MKKLTVLGVVAVVAAFSLSAMADGPDGKTLFGKKMCGACHGAGGEGKASGLALKGTALSEKDIVGVIKNGKGKMKAMTATDEEAAAIAKYVKSL